MKKVIGIKFRKNPLLYYCPAGDYSYEANGFVIVKKDEHETYATLLKLPFEIDENKFFGKILPFVRIATKNDLEKISSFERAYNEMRVEVTQEAKRAGLEMKIVDIDMNFSGHKMVIYFFVEERVDFRELLRKISAKYKIRVEFRQVGVRDETKMTGGLGMCGKVCCCASTLKEFPKVSIKMAKNQGLALNPTKINGLCGRLKCCLSYENETYEEINSRMPRQGSLVKTTQGEQGTVAGIHHIKERVKIKIVENDAVRFTEVPLSDIKFKKN